MVEQTIPGELIALATFPGIMVHELAHWFACRLTRTPVHKLCLFQPENPYGYVVHALPTHPLKQLVIGVAPVLVNSLLAILLSCWVGDRFLLDLPWYSLFGVWLALSIGMHAFPSEVDVSHTWAAIHNEQMPLFFKVTSYPLVAMM